MKAVPLLVISNVIALALVALLWMNQSDLEEKLASRRSPAARDADPAYDTDTDVRLRRLESQLASLRESPVEEAGARPQPTGGSDAPEPGVQDGDDPLPVPVSGVELEVGDGEGVVVASDPVMEAFRQRVAAANELNREEERINRMIDSIEELESNSRIATLSRKQKVEVARSLLAARERIPQIWRSMRENNDLRSLSRDERRTLFQNEFDSLRVAAQKELETVVPAADAKTIVDQSVSMRGPRGPRGRRGR